MPFGCNPNKTGLRDLIDDAVVFGGMFAALSRNLPPLSAALKSPQVLLGMFFNGYLLYSYLSGRATLADIAVFYFLEWGVYLALYVPRVFFQVVGDPVIDRKQRKARLEGLLYLVVASVIYPTSVMCGFTAAMTGFSEQLAIVLFKLKLGTLVFALQFCLGAFQFLTRPKHRYAYEAAVFPFGWYFAGQFVILPLIFFIGLPLWFLTESYAPGAAAFLAMRIVNEAGPQLAALKFDEDVEWNLKLAGQQALRKGKKPGTISA